VAVLDGTLEITLEQVEQVEVEVELLHQQVLLELLIQAVAVVELDKHFLIHPLKLQELEVLV
jgi:hypothetical protein